MKKADKKTDEEKGDDVLRRMLKTQPKPKINSPLTKAGSKEKQDGTPAKK